MEKGVIITALLWLVKKYQEKNWSTCTFNILFCIEVEIFRPMIKATKIQKTSASEGIRVSEWKTWHKQTKKYMYIGTIYSLYPYSAWKVMVSLHSKAKREIAAGWVSLSGTLGQSPLWRSTLRF